MKWKRFLVLLLAVIMLVQPFGAVLAQGGQEDLPPVDNEGTQDPVTHTVTFTDWDNRILKQESVNDG